MKIKYKILNLFIKVCSAVTVLLLLFIIGFIFINGIGGFSKEFIEGLWPIFVSTVYLVILSLLIAAPISIFAAIYLCEYAKQGKVVEVIRFSIESLASIPSIIYGLFGLVFFVSTLGMGYSMIAGALTISIMVMPVIVRTTDEAIKSVEEGLRESSLALGATKTKTLFSIVIPASINGIITGLILSIGRIVGETAAIYLTVGMVPKMPRGIFSPIRTLAVHIYILVAQAISDEQAYATGIVLILLVIIINMGAKFFKNRQH